VQTGAGRASQAGVAGHADSGAGNGAQAAAVRMRPAKRRPRAVWVVLLEMGLALGLAVFIVWWTWPKKRDPGDDDPGGKSG